MSAFIVSRTHIDTILCTLSHQRHIGELWAKGERFDLQSGAGLTRLGRVLWCANVASVLQRYPDDYPASAVTDATGYMLRFCKPVAPVAAIKLCHSLAYQSCEVDDWEDTLAGRLIDAMIVKLAHCLPGYDAAPWSINDPTHTLEQGRLL